jgi:hypothetical protein
MGLVLNLMTCFVARQKEDDRKNTPLPIPLPPTPDTKDLGLEFTSKDELIQTITKEQSGLIGPFT